MHRVIECRRRINYHGADHSGRSDSENMLSRVRQTSLIDITIVSSDDIESLHDRRELNYFEEKKLEPRRLKSILAKETYRRRDRHPRNDIEKEINERHRPFMTRNANEPRLR